MNRRSGSTVRDGQDLAVDTSPAKGPPTEQGLRRAPAVAAAKSVRQRRRPALILLGIALVAVFGVAGAWLATAGRDAQTVVIARQSIQAGQPITAADLGTTQVSGTITGAATVPGSDLESLTGKYATGPIPAGSLINPGSVVDRLTPKAGTAIVGVGLKPSQLPAGGLQAGDIVTLVATVSPQGGDTNTVKPGTTWKATVVTVGGTSDDGTSVVSFSLPGDAAVSAATAAGGGTLAVVLDQTVDGR